MAPPDVERLVLLGTEAGVVVEPAEEQRHGRIVLEGLHPAVQRLLQVLGRHVVPAESLKTCRALPHPLQGGPGLAEMGAFPGQNLGRGFRHANSSDAGSVGVGSEGSRYPQSSGKSMGLWLTVGVPERAIWLLVRCRPCPPLIPSAATCRSRIRRTARANPGRRCA